MAATDLSSDARLVVVTGPATLTTTQQRVVGVSQMSGKRRRGSSASCRKHASRDFGIGTPASRSSTKGSAPSLLGSRPAATDRRDEWARFLTRDPALAMTREPYAYAGDNPVNYTDPLGLSKCGQLSLGGFVDCASKTDDVVKSGAETVKLVGEAGAWATSEVLGAGITWADDHLGAQASACLFYCVSFEYSNGSFHFTQGAGGLYGATFSPVYNSTPRSEWTDSANLGLHGYYLGCEIDDDDPSNHSISLPGLGGLVGAGQWGFDD